MVVLNLTYTLKVQIIMHTITNSECTVLFIHLTIQCLIVRKLNEVLITIV